MHDAQTAGPELGWIGASPCRGRSEVFFGPWGETAAQRVARECEAKAICSACQARAECLERAVRTGERHGVWGGLTETERAALGDKPRLERVARHQDSTVRVVPERRSPHAEAHGQPVELRWEDPPAHALSLSVRLAPHLPELREHPGRWARLIDYPRRSSASMAATRLAEQLPDFEWRGVTLRDGGSALWGRCPHVG